jgi:hypothetical protein
MSAAPTTAALPTRPDPSQDQAAGSAPAATRNGWVLGLLRKLIDFGRDVVQTLQGRATPTDIHTTPSAVTRNFGTLDIALILMRIVRGLRLAAALEARLVRHPLREEAAPAAVRAPSDPASHTVKPVAPRASRAAFPLPDVPTAEEIAAAVRVRPVGAVIADICRDLGIGQSHPLWREVMMVVTEFDGSYVKLFNDSLDRLYSWLDDPSTIIEQGRATPWSQPAAACGTGPP